MPFGYIVFGVDDESHDVVGTDLYGKQKMVGNEELESWLSVEMMFFQQVCCFGRCTGISLIDSTRAPACRNKRICGNKVFKDYAAVGKSTMGWYFGFKRI